MIVNDGRKPTKAYQIGNMHFHTQPLEPALYIVATPIGNLRDMTIRGLETLAATDILACEDTRITRILLKHYGIVKRPIIYHEHNAQVAGPKLIAALQTGKTVTLICDAGTPLISDPGYRLVDEAKAAGHRIIPIPGPSAVLAALTISGLPTDRFFFAGFLPSKQIQRRAHLETLKAINATLIFFESPHRTSATLADMATIFGKTRKAALCRELTKIYETVVTAPLSELIAQFDKKDRLRGEIVLLVGPPHEAEVFLNGEEIDKFLLAFSEGMSPSKTAGEVARITGKQKGVLYQRLLELKGKHE